MEDGKFTRYGYSDLVMNKEHCAEILDWFRADDTSKVENLNAKG